MVFAIGTFFLGFHLMFYLIANKIRPHYPTLGGIIGEVQIALLLISIVIFGVGCVRSKTGIATKSLSLVLLIVLGLFIYSAPYNLSYDGSRFFVNRFDVWAFSLGAVVVALSFAYIWKTCFHR